MFRKRDLGSVNLTGAPPLGKEPPLVGMAFSRFLAYAGVILPTLALLFETQFHLCAKYFFDPFPSNSHTLIFCLVPIAGLLSWLVLGQNVRSQYGLALFTNGMAVGIAILYTLMFLPIMPASAAAIVYLGFGLLGLSPFFSLIALWASGQKLEKLHKNMGSYFEPPQVVHAGHLVILATVLAVELPSTVTRVAMGMACQPDSQEQGLSLLRAFGNQEVMLRACYERSGRATDVLGSLYEVSHPADVELMRAIFYKATGRTFNSFPIPESARSTMNHMGTLKYDGMDQGADDEFDLDPDVAGEVVSGVSRGLSVSKSKMLANVDSDAGVAQINWFLDFKNVSKFDREVRTRIKLPHGAAVNQASLIVNGKEFECDVTLKEEARQIYQAAVAAKQNPLLVSQCGKDTVLVQCYPVPPGEALQLHLGVVSPVELRKDMKGAMALPQFEERNFQINVPYSLKVEANHEITAQLGQLKNEKQKDKFILSGDLEPAALATGNGIITFDRDKKQEFWTTDIFATGEYARRLQIAKEKAMASKNSISDGVPGVSAGSSPGYEGSGGVAVDPSGGETNPPAVGEDSPPCYGEASPPSVGIDSPTSVGEASPPSIGEASPASVGEAVPPYDGDTAISATEEPMAVNQGAPRSVGGTMKKSLATKASPTKLRRTGSSTVAGSGTRQGAAVGIGTTRVISDGPTSGVVIQVDPEEVVSSPAAVPTIAVAPAIAPAIAPAPGVKSATPSHSGREPRIFEKIVDAPSSKPSSLMILVDLSNTMADHLKGIVSSLKNLPSDLYVQVVCVEDGGPSSLNSSWIKAGSAEFQNVLQKLSEKKCIGGQTDSALNTMLSACEPGAGVLWLHGPQPFGMQILDLDSQSVARYNRATNRVDVRTKKLFDMQVASGPNAFLDGVTSASLITVPRFSSVENDLNLLFENWKKPGSTKEFQFSTIGNSANETAVSFLGGTVSSHIDNSAISRQTNTELNAGQTNKPQLNASQTQMYQLAQLYAVSQINNYLQNHNEAAALNLAAKYHLVTAVSSAVLTDTVSELDRLSCPASEPSNDLIHQFFNLSSQIQNDRAFAAARNAASTLGVLTNGSGLGLTGCSSLSGSMSDNNIDAKGEPKSFDTIVNQLNRLNSVTSQPEPSYVREEKVARRAAVNSIALPESSSSFSAKGQVSSLKADAPMPAAGPTAINEQSDKLSFGSRHAMRQISARRKAMSDESRLSKQKTASLDALDGATNGTISPFDSFNKKEVAMKDMAPVITDRRMPVAEEMDMTSNRIVAAGGGAAGAGGASSVGGDAFSAGVSDAGQSAPGCAVAPVEAGKFRGFSSAVNLPQRNPEMPSTPCVEFKSGKESNPIGSMQAVAPDSATDPTVISGVNTAGTVLTENNEIIDLFWTYLTKYWFAFAGMFIFIYSLTKMTMEKLGIKDK